MEKVSLIIPVYNTQNYLEQCLLSAKNQTYRNMEIICVNDGSTDDSGRIVDSFAKADDRFVVIHQENAGESKARNAGLRICTGNYIGFMDCDDWIELDMYEKLVHAIRYYDVDLAASGWFKEENNGCIEIQNLLPVQSAVFGKEQLLRYVYERDSYRGFAYMWDKLYKRELFQGMPGVSLGFDETLKLGGDVLLLAQLLLNVNKAVYLNQSFYHYRQRMDSGCHSVNLSRRMDSLRAYALTIRLLEERKIEYLTIMLVKRFLVYHSSNIAELAYEQNNRLVLWECQKIMRQYGDEYERTNLKYPERIQRFEKILSYKLKGELS